MKVCLDTNILVSAAILDGNEFRLLKLARAKRFEVVLSTSILSELEKVLRVKIKMSDRSRYGYISHLREISKLVYPATKELRNTTLDAGDRKVVGTAIAGSCDYLVTGDKRLLGLKEVKGVKIIKASQLLSQLESD